MSQSCQSAGLNYGLVHSMGVEFEDFVPFVRPAGGGFTVSASEQLISVLKTVSSDIPDLPKL